jgi:3-oxoacyl-[acyl-carrier protein] reductase
MKLNELKVIVTGGASGMGRTFSLELAAAGAQVVAADVNTEALQEVTDASKGMVFGVECNVADEASVANLFEVAYKHMGAVNGLVNNAGIIRDGLLIKKDRETGEISNLSLKKWQQVIDVNLTGPFLCAREFATLAARNGVAPACMVNISSISRKGNPGQSNYSAAKAGLVSMTKLWSQELSRYGIRTGAIAPGPVDTPILLQMPEKARSGITRMVPLGRFADPKEIYEAVRFIFENDFFTGRCIELDGGMNL